MLPSIALTLMTAGLAATDPGSGGLLIQPVHVYLTAQRPTHVLTLRNQGSEPVRFQLTALAWTQDSTSEQILTATDDILISPPLLILAPGEERKIRLASRTSIGAVEKTYRLRIEQLQPPRTPGDELTQLRMLTVFSLPVFLSPAKIVDTHRLGNVDVDGGRWSVALANTGNIHMQVIALMVTGLDGTGHPVFETGLQPGYVLPGFARVFQSEPIETGCATVTQLRVRIKTPRGSTTEVLDVPPERCAKALRG